MIATTHVGSLPRGPELVPLLLARDKGEAYDADEFDRLVQAAVDEAVRKQSRPASAIVSDGELGKVGYSTYVIERLSGFGGHSRPQARARPRGGARAGEEARHIMGSQEFIRASAIARSSWSISSRRTTTSAAFARRSTGTGTASRRS